MNESLSYYTPKSNQPPIRSHHKTPSTYVITNPTLPSIFVSTFQKSLQKCFSKPLPPSFYPFHRRSLLLPKFSKPRRVSAAFLSLPISVYRDSKLNVKKKREKNRRIVNQISKFIKWLITTIYHTRSVFSNSRTSSR